MLVLSGCLFRVCSEWVSFLYNSNCSGMKKHLVTALLAVVFALVGVRVDAATWRTDYPQAVTQAQSSGSYVLLYFSGSDWCPWCMKLEEEVFSQPVFEEFAAKNLVCVMVDFPNQKPQTQELRMENWTLMQQFGVNFEFPTFVLLTPDGKELVRTNYQPGGAVTFVGFLQAAIERSRAAVPQ